MTDIIFYLLDLSGVAINNFIEFMLKQKQQTINDNKMHSFSLPPDKNYIPQVGISYISCDSNDPDILDKQLLGFCMLKKYKSKADVWIGLGSLMNSSNIIDALVFNDSKWKYDEALEETSKKIKFKGQPVINGKKVDKNEPCPCNSGLKFSECCYKLL
jgi:hypothetical protein